MGMTLLFIDPATLTYEKLLEITEKHNLFLNNGKILMQFDGILVLESAGATEMIFPHAWPTYESQIKSGLTMK